MNLAISQISSSIFTNYDTEATLANMTYVTNSGPFLHVLTWINFNLSMDK